MSKACHFLSISNQSDRYTVNIFFPKYVPKTSDLIKVSKITECKPCPRYSGETKRPTWCQLYPQVTDSLQVGRKGDGEKYKSL